MQPAAVGRWDVTMARRRGGWAGAGTPGTAPEGAAAAPVGRWRLPEWPVV